MSDPFAKLWLKKVLAIGRRTYYQPHLETYERVDVKVALARPDQRNLIGPEPDLDKANLVSSKVDISATDSTHAPCLDIDFPVHCIESSTPGHYHLYFEKVITWEQYEPLLRALATAGLIEQGYADASINRRGTFLRLPGIVKQPKEDE